jgi:hypothetical protein
MRNSDNTNLISSILETKPIKVFEESGKIIAYYPDKETMRSARKFLMSMWGYIYTFEGVQANTGYFIEVSDKEF